MTYEHIKRFVLLMEELRKTELRSTMVGSIYMPSGDVGYWHFLDPLMPRGNRVGNAYTGGVRLRGIDEQVAWADVSWAKGETKSEHFARFCDALEIDFVRRQEEAAA